MVCSDDKRAKLMLRVKLFSIVGVDQDLMGVWVCLGGQLTFDWVFVNVVAKVGGMNILGPEVGIALTIIWSDAPMSTKSSSGRLKVSSWMTLVSLK